MSHPSGKTRTKRPAPPPNSGPTADDYLEEFLTLLPTRVIQRLARETGFVQRHRKLDPLAIQAESGSERDGLARRKTHEVKWG